jgi:ATP-dependent DNA helicase RecG
MPNSLTVEKISTDNSNIRNPILVFYVAKSLLPYHGLGSSLKCVLAAWSEIDLTDDRKGDLFTAIVHRKLVSEMKLANDSREILPDQATDSPESGQQILDLISSNPQITTALWAGRWEFPKGQC